MGTIIILCCTLFERLFLFMASSSWRQCALIRWNADKNIVRLSIMTIGLSRVRRKNVFFFFARESITVAPVTAEKLLRRGGITSKIISANKTEVESRSGRHSARHNKTGTTVKREGGEVDGRAVGCLKGGS